MLKKMFTALLDFFYPPLCASCGKPVESSGRLCEECRGNMAFVRAYRASEGGLPYLDGAIVLAHYRSGLQNVLQKVKFGAEKKFLPLLAGEMNFLWENGGRKELQGLLTGGYKLNEIAVIPVPTDAERLLGRGYDLPTEIFHAWSDTEGYSWHPCLQRVRNTKPQYELSGLERRNNMAGVMRADYLTQETVLLIVDDIMTTGATFCECARALREANGEKRIIIGLALASDAIKL
jgi:ComF family protein